MDCFHPKEFLHRHTQNSSIKGDPVWPIWWVSRVQSKTSRYPLELEPCRSLCMHVAPISTRKYFHCWIHHDGKEHFLINAAGDDGAEAMSRRFGDGGRGRWRSDAATRGLIFEGASFSEGLWGRMGPGSQRSGGGTGVWHHSDTAPGAGT